MKSFSRYINESRINYIDDKTRLAVDRGVVGSKDVIGVIGLDKSDIYLLPLDSHDKSWIASENVKLKPGERIFRYTSKAASAGGIKPLVKLNMNSGLLYFSTQKAHDEGIIDFETKATKTKYITIAKSLL